ncbi:MAG TPA: ABC transporter ATP-binding protein [Streptosporangiaceae bacterium]|nr:ABC transporter ATP-binding protein [Streptosporangiaceae bacterium]
MPAPDRGLAVSDLTGRAGSFGLGPVSLAIEPGQVLAILGPSAAGKTTLLETIAGLRPHRSGRITLAGTDITTLPPEQRRIGLVFQDAALFPHLSVARNIQFGPRARRQPPAPGLDALLARLGITPLAARSPRSLSGGERQRVALARALATQPGLLLLDEPLSALDQPTREDLRTLLRELLAALDIPAVHVTHDRDEALSISDDLAVIINGQLRQAGPAGQLTAAPADPDTARLLGWTELGPGTAAHGTVTAGQLHLPGTASPRTLGPVRIFYRPEDLTLSTPAPGTPAAASLTAPASQILPTRPLARVTLASDPPVTALLLHQHLEPLHLHPGEPVTASFSPASVRIFPAPPPT